MKSETFREVVGKFPEFRPDRVGVVSARGGDGVVVVEYHGARVGDPWKSREKLRRALAKSGFRGRVEMVRAGWLASGRKAVGTAGIIKARIAGLDRGRRVPEISDGSFSVLPERDKDKFAFFGNHSKIRTPAEVFHPGTIFMGNWVSLGRYGKIVMLPDRAFEDPGSRIVEQHYPHLVGEFHSLDPGKGRKASLVLGDGTTLGDRYFIICTNSIEFGRHVMTSANLFVTDCRHIYENTEIPPALLPMTMGRPVRIEDHAWIGINCCILEGVTIGRHAVVAANSVVNRDVPPYTLVAGSPASIRKEFSPREISRRKRGSR